MLIRWQRTIVDQRGNVQPGAVLTIRRMSDQAIVTVYRDREGTQPYPTGTVTADENGYAYFYASPGLYRITSIQPAIDWPDESLAATFVTLGGGPFSSVQDGLVATSDGEFFSVAPSSQSGALFDLYQNVGGEADLIGAFPSMEAIQEAINATVLVDSRTINGGKAYPYVRRIRAGNNFEQRQQFSDAILDAYVYGANPLYYYRMLVMGNGSATLGGPTGQGIRMERCLISQFETTGQREIIHLETSSVGLGLDYAVGGVQRSVVTMDVTGETLVLLIDVDKLPPYGEAISSTETQLGANWVYDPSNCFTFPYFDEFLKQRADIVALQGRDTLTVNRGNNYPCEVIVRNASSPMVVHPWLRDSLLAAKVRGAKRGYSYRIAFIGNGATSVPPSPNYGVNITRIPNDRMAEGYEQNIVTYDMTSAEVRPDRAKGGIQTFIIPCPLDPRTEIELTFDVDAMPPDGTAFSITNPAQPGYNSRICPDCYEYRDEYEWVDGEVLVDYTAVSNALKVGYKSGDRWYRIHCARRSINDTFAMMGFGYAPAYSSLGEIIPIEKAAWITRAESDNDWHSPVVLRALTDGDIVVNGTGTVGDPVTVFKDGSQIAASTVDSAGQWAVRVNDWAILGDVLQVQVGAAPQADYTVVEPLARYSSGSHGTDGTGGGSPTAEQRELLIYIDGQPLNLAADLQRRARRVLCIGTIAVKAYNTFLSRFVADQNYTYTLGADVGLWVTNQLKVYEGESLRVLNDNGTQMYLAGMTPTTSNTYLFWGGNTPARVTMPEGTWNSGPKSQYPAVMGVTVRHPVAGEQSVWIDLGFGAGNRDYLGPSDPLFDHPNPTGKIYPRIFGSVEATFNAGESYEWRGGWYWGRPNNTAEHDAIRNTQAGTMLLKHTGKYTVVPA